MLNWAQSEFASLREALHQLLMAFTSDGGSRIYWLSLMTGLIIAYAAYARRDQQRTFADLLFSREIWLGRSAINDYAVLLIGAALRATLLASAFFHWEDIAVPIIHGLQQMGVAGQVHSAPSTALAVAFTVVLFVADDFLRWLHHWLMHAIPELWEFHKVHHSAELLNFATVERFHPFEVVLSAAMLTIGYGMINGIFIAFFGELIAPITLLGANVLVLTANLLGGALRHSPFWVGFGTRVERWIVSPAMHQIHHSDAKEHAGRNLGSTLSIWDRLFGTLTTSQGEHVRTFGIGEETAEFRSLQVIFFRPFVAAAKAAATRLAGHS
jgi:sterol desaturase/sphingolipid hydroxylase (fatty acid hydroxylase superfamily)